MVVTLDGQMLLAGLQVLANGQNVHADPGQIAHHFDDFLEGLPQSKHDAALGQHQRIEPLGIGQCRQRPFIAILRLHLLKQARHRLNVVIQDLRLGVHNDLQRFLVALEIRDQDFDRTAGLKLANAADHHRKDWRSAIFTLITVHGGNHHMLEIHRRDGLGHPVWFAPVHHCGASGLDVAETAGAGTDIPQHQKGCRPFSPAFTQIGAHGFFTNGVEFLAAH